MPPSVTAGAYGAAGGTPPSRVTSSPECAPLIAVAIEQGSFESLHGSAATPVGEAKRSAAPAAAGAGAEQSARPTRHAVRTNFTRASLPIPSPLRGFRASLTSSGSARQVLIALMEIESGLGDEAIRLGLDRLDQLVPGLDEGVRPVLLELQPQC